MIGFGAIIAFIFGFLGLSPMVQIFAFIISSIIFLLTLKPVIKKYFSKEIPKTNVDALFGERGIVTKRISNLDQEGEVKLKGLHYTARNNDGDDVIEEGTQVTAVRIEGVKLFVTAHSSQAPSETNNKE